MSVVIKTENVSFSVNKKYILQNINFEIENNDCVAVIGPNGAGKTTIFRLLTGLLEHSEGKIKIFNNEINSQTKKKIGYIPQNLPFDNFMPILVKDIIYMGFLAKNGIFKNYSSDDICLAEEISKKLGISKLMQQPLCNISGGERQKVSIARVLVQNAKILLMDEPLSNIDISSQKDILKIINDTHSNKDITSMIIVHNLHQIPDCCNKVMLVSDGKIFAFGKKEDILNSEKFEMLWNF